MFREVAACRICGNPELLPVLSLGSLALTGVFPDSPDRPVASAPLELVRCDSGSGRESCGLVQLRHSVEPALLFGIAYGYRSSLNRWMVEHLRGIAARLKKVVPLAPGDAILDIGSNDGTLLDAFAAPGVELIGTDPTADRFREFYPPEALVIPERFSAPRFLDRTGNKRAKIVTSIAMFYDLEQPLDFVDQVRSVLDDGGIWFCEQSYLRSMLDSTAYDTICHEHLEYYALKQILWLAGRAGLRILDVSFNASNGGSFALLMAKEGSKHWASEDRVAAALQEEARAELEAETVFRAFRERILRRRDELRALLGEYRARGECVLGYGASTKGNVILQFCGVTAKELPCIAEVNKDKFGCFTPGTGIPIVSESSARERKPDAFLVLPWHFREAIIAREAEYLARGGALVFPLPEVQVHRPARAAGTE